LRGPVSLSTPRPRVLVTRCLPGPALALLSRTCRIDLNRSDRNLTSAEIRNRIGSAEGLLCLPVDRIDASILRAAPRLRGIANCAVGVDNIDLEEAKRRGILVANTPGVLTAATADLTWALLLAVTRRVVEGDRAMREGKFLGWAPAFMLGRSLGGRVLGVVGMGRIGQAVARRAPGFGVSVAYYSRSRLAPRGERGLRARYLPLARLLATSDIVTIHVPLTQRTRGMIGSRELTLMKPGSFLINTSRGEVVEEGALIKELRSGRIAGAGLDVYAREPKVPSALRRLPQVVLLPHLGSATVETREEMGRMAAENLLAILHGRRPPNLVI